MDVNKIFETAELLNSQLNEAKKNGQIIDIKLVNSNVVLNSTEPMNVDIMFFVNNDKVHSEQRIINVIKRDNTFETMPFDIEFTTDRPGNTVAVVSTTDGLPITVSNSVALRKNETLSVKVS